MILRSAVTIWLICIIYTRARNPSSIEPLLIDLDKVSAEMILNTTRARIADSDKRVDSLYIIKQDNLRSAPFEVGYLVQVIQEKYRKMIDKYNTSDYMKTELYVREHLLYLSEIEHHYWEIEHLVNMLHEIERKYEMREHEEYVVLNASLNAPKRTPVPRFQTIVPTRKKFRSKKKKHADEIQSKMDAAKHNKKFKKDVDRHNLYPYWYSSTTLKPNASIYPHIYGWDVPFPIGA